MLSYLENFSQFFDRHVNPKRVRIVELIILRLALLAFVLHLAFIYLSNNVTYFSDFQHSYLKAIYTPFSFILFYEVLLLVIIIPKSISEFIGKQFEVITLITLRSFFHDIADLDFGKALSIEDVHLLSLVYDLIASLLMLAATMFYYKIYKNSQRSEAITDIQHFVAIKKVMSFMMMIILFLLSFSSLGSWVMELYSAMQANQNYPNPNTVFYGDFFTVMIFMDVFLLIVSFMYHFSFYMIFRNASFIITTILLRMSLTAEKPINYFLIFIGFAFSILAFYLINNRKNSKG
ncbi:hypothetical protein [Aquirufa sp.]|jgi:hypothetical protein|uniref:hypothetical protein n=1 Tax=Aquirufa sp. TaxID=2676249 RepID=UPI0037C1261E